MTGELLIGDKVGDGDGSKMIVGMSVVASVLMSMGMMMLPPITISMPFKLIFFVLVDGWHLLSGSLVNSFR